MAKTGFFQNSGSTATTENDIQTQVDAAEASATAAAASATSASTSATNAANSVSSIGSSVTSASNSAAASATSASNSSASASSSETAKVASEASQAAAETAETNSETAKVASEAAQSAAETAQAAAETAEANAASSASSASASEVNAAASATSASSSSASAVIEAADAATSKVNASNSAAAASTSETNSAASASSASASEATSTTKASQASTSASNAASSASSASAAQTAAESARDSALAAFDSFDDRYLGSFTSANQPTTDNDGDALVAGSLYYDVTASAMKVYTGSAWVAAYVSGTDFAALSGATFTGNVTVPNLITSGNVDGRDVSVDGSKLDGIESGATADQSASEILTAVKTVDGASSGLDSDLLDGQHGSHYLNYNNFTNTPTLSTTVTALTDTTITSVGDNELLAYDSSSSKWINQTPAESGFATVATSGAYSDLSGKPTIPTATSDLTNDSGFVTSSGNVFSATKLQYSRTIAGVPFNGLSNIAIASTNLSDAASINASTLDSIDSTQFLRSDAADTKTSGDLSFSDNVKAIFGAGSDLQIYHDGTDSVIKDTGTGNLVLTSNGGGIFLRNNEETETYANFNNNGSVQLRYDNSTKFETTSTGVDITGDLNAVNNIFLASTIYHEGDTNNYMQFHATDQWRVVTGGTEMLEINNNYILAGSNTVGKVHTDTNQGAGTHTPNLYVYNSFVWTLTGNITLGNPSTEATGMSGVFIFIHSGAGRTVSLGSQYKTAGGAGLTLSGTAGAVDIVPYFVRSASNILLGTPQLAFS